MKLLVPEDRLYESYIEAGREYKRQGIDTYHFLELPRHRLFSYFEDLRFGKNMPENYVPSTYLWLSDGDEFLGEINIRHRLNDELLRFGGNIGYGVRISEWGKGLGTTMLAEALKYAGGVVGLERALITCNDNNIASARVIEKNGGRLQDVITNIVDGVTRRTRRYWINIP